MRSPSRVAHGSTACALRWRPWRQLSRSAALAAAWRSAAALLQRRLTSRRVRGVRRPALSECRRWRGCFLSQGDRRRASPLPMRSPSRVAHGSTACVQRWRPWHRLSHDTALAGAWRSAAAFSQRRFISRRVRGIRRPALSECPHWRGGFLSQSGRRHASLTAPLLARGAGAPGADSVVPPRPRRRDDRPSLFRSGGSLLGASVVLSGRRSLSAVVCAVASSPEAVAVARRSRRRCLRAALTPLAPAQS